MNAVSRTIDEWHREDILDRIAHKRAERMRDRLYRYYGLERYCRVVEVLDAQGHCRQIQLLTWERLLLDLLHDMAAEYAMEPDLHIAVYYVPREVVLD